MIAVALSGGVDSAAAAVLLKESGEDLVGVTFIFGASNPPRGAVERAGSLCARLGIPHETVDMSAPFKSVMDYFCREYLSGRTPNPCVACNRDIKFGLFLEKAEELGADRIATGHYARKISTRGRAWLGRAREKNSQEYFLGLLSQEALERSIFPLNGTSKAEARQIAASTGLDIHERESSQDVCFVGHEGYAGFISSRTGHEPQPGDILNRRGIAVGRHRGALFYTIGQRKGLGMGFGRRVYVLEKNMDRNTITVGDRSQWPFGGFFVERVNFMKIPSLTGPLPARVKVRYRQDAQEALLVPMAGGGMAVRYEGLFSPGQLAVAYDEKDELLCAGIIHSPLKDIPGSPEVR
ncbi:MAG: tRNA 2-thiouridine(34) synthase MnmA [Desulfomonilia bacterium]|jgi:tRNA-specific 2-thiouridylase